MLSPRYLMQFHTRWQVFEINFPVIHPLSYSSLETWNWIVIHHIIASRHSASVYYSHLILHISVCEMKWTILNDALLKGYSYYAWTIYRQWILIRIKKQKCRPKRNIFRISFSYEIPCCNHFLSVEFPSLRLLLFIVRGKLSASSEEPYKVYQIFWQKHPLKVFRLFKFEGRNFNNFRIIIISDTSTLHQ